jgi:HSP20 family protein
MKLIKYDSVFSDPWTDLDRFFEETFGELPAWTAHRDRHSSERIPTDVLEDGDKIILRMELPGVNREDIHLELENAVLTVSASRATDTNDGKAKLQLKRTYTVGEAIDPDKVNAHLENGILTVELGKREQAKARQINIA